MLRARLGRVITMGHCTLHAVLSIEFFFLPLFPNTCTPSSLCIGAVV